MYKRYRKGAFFSAAVIGCILSGTVVVALAAEKSPVQMAKYRQTQYEELGKAFKFISEEIYNPNANVEATRAAAQHIRKVSIEQYTWFPGGSGPELGGNAKVEIWTDPAVFALEQKRFREAAAKFVALADAGDLAGMKAQFRPLSTACSSCHDKFHKG